MARAVLTVIAVIQTILAIQFARRVWRTIRGKRISAEPAAARTGSVSVIVPVLNEVHRVGQCLESLLEQGAPVEEILVVDGGSTDGTDLLVSRYAERDQRVRLVRTGPIPDGWNGKAFGLQAGLDHSSAETKWILTVDADVQVRSCGINRTVAFAESERVPVLSVATTQIANSPGLSAVHPSLLSTLVYRFGVPGHVARTLDDVQANGQFALYDRIALLRVNGFEVARDSICEDITIARHLFLSGYQVGFYEGDDVAVTEMYPDAVSCLQTWPRSLALRDRFMPNAGATGLLSLAFLQVMPLITTLLLPRSIQPGYFTMVNRILFGVRLGIAFGTRRAYERPFRTYWLSPLFDPVTLVFYVSNLLRRTHVWRGRQLVSRES